MDDLTKWLKDCLDEDEKTATAVFRDHTWSAYIEGGDDGWAIEGAHSGEPSCIVGDEAMAAHIARHDPARVLREVEAKRLLLGDHTSPHTVVDGFCVEEGVPCTHAGEGYCQIDSWEGCRTQRLLALPYADHPGYRSDWRP